VRTAAVVIGVLALFAVVVLGRGLRGPSPDYEVTAPPPQPSPIPLSADKPIILSGVGSQTTKSFYLAGGTYHSIWSAWGEAAEFPPCLHSVALMAANRASGETSNAHVIDLAKLVDVPATGASEERIVGDLKPGNYYLEVRSECAWEVSLSVK
jgi:hypothetical protein